MNIKDYFILYGHFVKNNIIAQMEFRSNFIISIFIEIAFLMSKCLYIVVVFSLGSPINGFTPNQTLMFIGSYTFITGIMCSVYYLNIVSIPEYIRGGDLDLYLCKPVSSQFIASFRKFDLGLVIPNVIGGSIMIGVSWIGLGIPFSIKNILGYIFLTLVGCIIAYPLLLIPITLSFWIIKTEALNDIIWALWDFNNMPMSIYNRVIQNIGIFLIPIFLITNFAPMFVMGLLPNSYFIYSIIAVPLFILLSILFWNVAVKHYKSASS